MGLRRGTWLRLVVSGGLFFLLLFYLVDLRAAGRALAQCHVRYLAGLALWLTLDRLLMSYKWQLLLACRGVDLSQAQALRAYYVATFAGSFLPSTVGADALRVGAVSSAGRSSAVVAASVFVERVLGFVAAALAALLALALLAGLSQVLPLAFAYWTLGLLAGLVFLLALSLSERCGPFLENLGARLKRRGRIGSWAARFLLAYHSYRHHRATLAWFLALSFIEQCAPVVSTWLAALALDIKLSLIQAAAVTPLACFFSRLPVAVSSFGVVEGLYVAFFALVGLNTTDSFLLGFLFNLAVVFTTLPGLFFYLTGEFRPAPPAC